MKYNLKFLVVAALLCVATIGSASWTRQVHAQAAAGNSFLPSRTDMQFRLSGPRPSTWQFDPNGRLLSIPGRMEATYDMNGQLVELTLHEAVKGGSRTTKYTLVPGATPGKSDVRITYTQDGNYPVTGGQVFHVSSFTMAPYFFQVQASGQLVRITTAESLKADPSKILGGVAINCLGQEDVPLFVGAQYGDRIGWSGL